MNRVIKFRAFDKNFKKIVFDVSFDYELGKWIYYREKEHGTAIISVETSVGDDTIMQYTGLKDKNGKKIFEGDIVVKNEYMWFDEGKPNYRGTVEWIYSQWQVVAHCVNANKRGASEGINEGLNDEGFDENGFSDWVVIGNIFENKELLEKVHQ